MTESNKKVVVIDDDELVRDSIAELFSSVNYTVDVYSNAKEFLAEFDQNEIACILLDVRMPGMSGIELQRKLNEMNILIPIIIMTAHGDITMAVQAMKDGAFEFLQKPFRDQELLDVTAKAIEKNIRDTEVLNNNKQIQDQINKLTLRERQVVDCVLEGKPNKIIAKELGVSDRTIEIHRSHAMQKLSVKSVAELVKMMMHCKY